MLSEKSIIATICINIIEKERFEWDQLLSEVLQRVREWDRNNPDDTAWSLDRLLALDDDFLEDVLEESGQHFQLLLFAIRDYVDALELLIRGEEFMVQPAWSLSRGILEAVVTSLWLIDINETPESRVARYLSVRALNIQGSLDTLYKLPNSETTQRYKDRIKTYNDYRSELIDEYGKNNIEILYKNDSQNQLTENIRGLVFRGQKVFLSSKMTDLIEKFLPDELFLYPLFSGASHSSIWFLSDLDQSEESVNLISTITPLVFISQLYIIAICKYFGIDETLFLENNQKRLREIASIGKNLIQRREV